MYKYKESKGLKRNGGAIWWAIVLLALGELIILALVLNQNRMLHSTINSISTQLEEFQHADPSAVMDQQFEHVNLTMTGVLDILSSMKLTDDQMERLNRLWPSPVPAQPEESPKPVHSTN